MLLPHVLAFRSRTCFVKILFFLGSVFEVHFRDRIFVLLFCCALVFLVVFAYGFACLFVLS